MTSATKFYLVSAEALPEIFIKVAEAKRMLHSDQRLRGGDHLGGNVRDAGVDRGDDGHGLRARGGRPLRYSGGLRHRISPAFIRWIGGCRKGSLPVHFFCWKWCK